MFNKWCDENGILHPACRYPVAFGDKGELIGISATRDIGVGEAYIYVPTKCIINETKFRNDPQIGHLIDKHPELFSERGNCDHMKLIFFLMHEMGKGENSFWHYYFEAAELPDLLANWESTDLDELHDPILRVKAMDEMEDMRLEFGEIRDVALVETDCLKLESFTFEAFMKANYHVGTRVFGYALPELSLVPFADMANHHTTDN